MALNDIDAIGNLTLYVDPLRATGLDDYYNGVSRLRRMGLALPPELEALQTVVNWPRLVVDSLEERLDVEGFRMGGAQRADERLWGWWQANRLDEESSLGHIEALVQGQAAIFIGANENDPETPIFTVESLRDVYFAQDYRTGQVQYVVRIYEYDPDTSNPMRAAVYRPGVTRYYHHLRGYWVTDYTVQHDLPVATAVPLTNRARLGDRNGRSEMADIIPLTDAACRTLSNLQGAQELLAVPQRYVLGAQEGDFVGADGQQKTTWEAYLGRFLALENSDAKIGQLAGADLRNFTEVINHYARLVSALSGLPPHFLGLATDTPPSADAIRSSEARLVKRAERRSRAFGDAWEQAMRIGMMIVDGPDLSPDAKRIETVWRDPATPTYAAKADAVVKLHASGLLPREAAWEELGYSIEKRRLLLAMSDDDPAVRYLASQGQLADGG